MEGPDPLFFHSPVFVKERPPVYMEDLWFPVSHIWASLVLTSFLKQIQTDRIFCPLFFHSSVFVSSGSLIWSRHEERSFKKSFQDYFCSCCMNLWGPSICLLSCLVFVFVVIVLVCLCPSSTCSCQRNKLQRKKPAGRRAEHRAGAGQRAGWRAALNWRRKFLPSSVW